MNLSYYRWKRLFLFASGLFIGTAFCMKWMEEDFWSNNERFTILGLEIFYSKDKLTGILGGIDDKVRTILRYHLYFDFAFMAAVYPGIAALCRMAREKTGSPLVRKTLLMLAAAQLLAWTADIVENNYLLGWIEKPVTGNEFEVYHLAVGIKWIIALAGLIFSIPILLRRKFFKRP